MYSLCKILSHVIHSCLCLSSLTSCHLSVAISHSLTGCQLNHAYGQSKFSHEFSRYWDWVGYSGLPPVLVSIAFVPSPSISRCFLFTLLFICHWISFLFLLYERHICTLHLLSFHLLISYASF